MSEDVITRQLEWLKARNLGGNDQLIKMMRLIESLEDENAQLKEELDAYRKGGLTEDILRRHNGSIKLANGCTIVRDEEYTQLKAVIAAINTAGLTDAVITAIIERDQLKAELAKLKEGA